MKKISKMIVGFTALFISSVVFAEERPIVISAKTPTEITIPAKNKLIVISAEVDGWSMDPLASVQNFMMTPGTSFAIKVDKKTKSDIKVLIDGREVWVRDDIAVRALKDVEAQVDSSLSGNGVVTVNLKGDDYGWVTSEIWKKYLAKRNPKAKLDIAHHGACGEEGSLAAKAKRNDTFKGEFPGVGIPVGSLVARSGKGKAIQLCKHGDTFVNSSSSDLKVILEINDNQPLDNSGEIRLIYTFAKLGK